MLNETERTINTWSRTNQLCGLCGENYQILMQVLCTVASFIHHTSNQLRSAQLQCHCKSQSGRREDLPAAAEWRDQLRSVQSSQQPCAASDCSAINIGGYLWSNDETRQHSNEPTTFRRDSLRMSTLFAELDKRMRLQNKNRFELVD